MGDHPRSRGEYKRLDCIFIQKVGSSPLSRGIPSQIGQVITCPGIIPALAGNTPRCRDGQIPRSDHPRSRGEYGWGAAPAAPPPGSSPLSRGILIDEYDRLFRIRIIPALAGNTPPAHLKTHRMGDHPRSRGEYVPTLREKTATDGSSPLSRGIPGRCPLRCVRPGIIPALAGNTTDDDSPEALSVGSSPLSRGIRPRSRGHRR